MRPPHPPLPALRLLAITSLVAALIPAACLRSAAPSAPAPVPAAAVTSIPIESRVRVMLAGGADDGWLEGRWVVTSVGCHGVLLTEAQLLVLLPTLAAVERVAGDGEGWQPVPLSQLRDGDGCSVASTLTPNP